MRQVLAQTHSHAYALLHKYKHSNSDLMHAQTHIHTIPTFNLYIMLKFIKNLKLIKNTNYSLTLFSLPRICFLGVGVVGWGKISPFPVLYF